MLFENMVIDGMYQVVREIGSGGMGVIYLAYHLRLEKYVVLKQIKNPYASLSMLRNEVDILKSLHHPFLPQVYDFMEYEGNLYTVIDYIDGYDFNYYIQNGWQFPESQLIKWLRQLCEVLRYLHTQQPPILHTDIKPGNIIITTGGDICLIDFGISVYNTDVIKGLSENYSSPEQYGNYYSMEYGDGSYFPLDERTDIYSLGATFYHIMTGVCPDVRNPEQLPIEAYSLPFSEAFVSIISRMMQQNLNQRYRNADAVLRAIDNIRKQDARYKKFVLMQIAFSAIAAVMIVSGILLTVSGYRQSVKSDFERDYNSFLSQVNTGDAEQAAQTGMHLLGQSAYSSMMDNGQRAALLYKIGDCFYSEEDYYNAAYYYEQSLTLGKNEQAYRDCVLALIRDGRSDEAQRYIDEIRANYPDSAVLAVVQAQFCYAQGDYNGAVATVDQNAALFASDAENCYAANLIKGDAYNALRNYAAAAAAYSDARNAKETAVGLRKLGNAWLQAAALSGNTSDQRAAMECFDTLSQRYQLNTDDALNLAQTALILGDTQRYEDCKSQLLQFAERREDCRLYILLAQLADATGDASAEKYCAKAHELYDNMSDEERAYISLQSLASVKQLYQKYCGPEW